MCTSPAKVVSEEGNWSKWNYQGHYIMLKDHFSKWSEMKSLSRVQVFTTPWTVAYQSTEFSRARILEWVAIFFSRDLPDPGMEPGSPVLQADALPSEPPGNFPRRYSNSKCMCTKEQRNKICETKAGRTINMKRNKQAYHYSWRFQYPSLSNW